MPHDGLIRYFWFFNIERVLLVSPEAIKEVLVTRSYDFEKPSGVRHLLTTLLGNGLLVAEGDEHKHQRKSLMPAFSFRHIKDLYPEFWAKTQEGVNAMTEEMGEKQEGEFEALEWASRQTLDVIGVAAIGRDFGAIQDDKSKLVNTYRKIFHPSTSGRIIGLLSTVIPLQILDYLPVKRNDNVRLAVRAIRKHCQDVIEEKRAEAKEGIEGKLSILSVSLESGLDDEQLINQLMTFLAAGHETTATSMAWAIYMLCCHPEMQDKLRAEVREHLGTLDRDITNSDIDRMPYLQAFISEIIRYWSPVPTFVRDAPRDTTVLNQLVPANTRFIISTWATNLDSNLWGDDADTFRPERWLALGEDDAADRKAVASGGAVSNFAMLSFSHGPRSCIGSSFARAEFACLLAGWVGRFEFELVNKESMDREKLEVRTGITARPADGVQVIAKVIPGF